MNSYIVDSGFTALPILTAKLQVWPQWEQEVVFLQMGVAQQRTFRLPQASGADAVTVSWNFYSYRTKNVVNSGPLK